MSKLNQILAGLLAVQVLGILGMRLGGDEPTKITSVKLLEGLQTEKVSAIEIWGAPKEGDGPDQETVKLTKTGTQWGIATADNFPADNTKVSDFLKTLAKLKSRNTVLTKATYHKKLEVSADKFQRKVTLTHDGKLMTFYVGSSPSFKNTHIRVDGKDEVMMVNDFSNTDVGERAYHWVDRAYLQYKPEEVWSVKVKNAKGEINLEKNPQDGSWVEASITQPLKKTEVDGIVNKARQINLETPVGKTEKPEYGLSAPLATVTLITGTSTSAGVPPQKTTSHTIKIGKKLEGKNQYYVKSSTSEYVVRVANWAISPLVEKGKDDLIEKPQEKKK